MEICDTVRRPGSGPEPLSAATGSTTSTVERYADSAAPPARDGVMRDGSVKLADGFHRRQRGGRVMLAAHVPAELPRNFTDAPTSRVEGQPVPRPPADLAERRRAVEVVRLHHDWSGPSDG